jgi:hypothetical protein
MRPCPACAKPFRKGKRIGVLQEDGSITVALCCQDCAKRCFRVVQPIGGAAQRCTICQVQPARVCSTCAARARATLVFPILQQLTAFAVACEANGQDEKAEGFRSAKRALELECERAI